MLPPSLFSIKLESLHIRCSLLDDILHTLKQ